MKKLLIILFLSVAFHSYAQKVIVLSTGDTIYGKVVSADDDFTSIESKDGKRIKVSNERVLSITRESEFEVDETAGKNLMDGAEIAMQTFAVVIVGVVASAIIIALAPQLATVAIIVAGVATLTGAIGYVSAWQKIHKAGKILQLKKM